MTYSIENKRKFRSISLHSPFSIKISAKTVKRVSLYVEKRKISRRDSFDWFCIYEEESWKAWEILWNRPHILATVTRLQQDVDWILSETAHPSQNFVYETPSSLTLDCRTLVILIMLLTRQRSVRTSRETHGSHINPLKLRTIILLRGQHSKHTLHVRHSFASSLFPTVRNIIMTKRFLRTISSKHLVSVRTKKRGHIPLTIPWELLGGPNQSEIIRHHTRRICHHELCPKILRIYMWSYWGRLYHYIILLTAARLIQSLSLLS